MVIWRCSGPPGDSAQYRRGQDIRSATGTPGPQSDSCRIHRPSLALRNRTSIPPRDSDLCHHALEHVVGLCAHHQVAVGDDVRRNAIDPKLLSLETARIEVVAEPVRVDGGFHAG